MDEMKLLSYFNGELSEEEVLQVETWSKASEENRKLLEQIYYTAFVGDRVAVMNSVDVEGSLKKLKVAMKPKESAVKKRRSIGWKRYAIPLAAFLTGIVFTIGFSYLALNKTSNYIVATTAGQRAQFVLPDGSKVWLNASTQLAYKSSLWSRERQVNLTGEAYFEVSKNGQPFIVNANGMQVEVLGTAFNISAYPNEEYQTTLVNGSVKVSAEKGESLILKPSQQATIALGSNSIQVRTVDTSFYTSWVKGKINFKDQRLEDIMKTLSRWYDMNVVYENEKLKNIRFGCNLNRYEEITPFVKLLEKTEEVHVKIEGNTITFHN